MPAGADPFAEALRIGAEVFHTLKALLHERGLVTAVGDEGGFAPDLGSSEEAIEVVLEAVERAGHRRARSRSRSIRRRRSSGADGAYRFEGREKDPAGDGRRSGRILSDRYPIVSIEDGLAEDEWAGLAAS